MSSSADSIDPALRELFRSEVETHTQTLTEGLLALERDPSQTQCIEGLMRAAHSIKGAARIVGRTDSAKVAHAMEDVLVAARDGRLTLTSEAADVLLRGVDLIQQTAAGVEADLDAFLTRLTAIREGRIAATLPPQPLPLPEAEVLAIAVRFENGQCFVAPKGSLSPERADELRRTLLDLRRQGTATVQLDLAAVEDVSPAALALLATLARASPRVTALLNVQPAVASLLQVTGLQKVYPARSGAVS